MAVIPRITQSNNNKKKVTSNGVIPRISNKAIVKTFASTPLKKQTSPKPTPKVIKKDEPGGLFDIIGKTAENISKKIGSTVASWKDPKNQKMLSNAIKDTIINPPERKPKGVINKNISFIPEPKHGTNYYNVVKGLSEVQKWSEDYIQNRIFKTADEGKELLKKPKSVKDVAYGTASAFSATYNATPLGVVQNVGLGTGAGAVKTLRTGEPLSKTTKEAITQNVSPTAYAVPEANPVVAFVSDLVLSGPKSVANLVKKVGSIKTAQNLKGINPRAFDLSKESISELEQIVDVIKNKSGRTTEQYKDALKGMQTFLDEYAPGYSVSNNKKALNVAERILDIHYGVEAKSPFPKLGLVGEETGPKVERMPSTQATQELSPSGIRAKSPTSDLRQSSSQGYTQTQKVSSAIEQTAKINKESSNIVRRVVKSVGDVKTKVVEYVQNEQERVRKLVNRKDVKVDDVSDPYLKATLYPGRVSEKISQGQKEAEVIIKDMKKTADTFKSDLANVRKQVNDYLYFKHAPERNAALGEKAAGITTQEAQTGLSAIENSPQAAKIKELADKASNLNKQTLDVLKNSGVISDDLYTTLRTKYQNHVPLNRIFEETEDIGATLGSKGFDVRTTGIRRAKGSEREVDDILNNIITNYEQAVIRSEKNIVDLATLNFVRKNQDVVGDLMQIVKPKAIGTGFQGQILTEKTTDPTILQMFENGKRVWIKINDPNLAIALRGVGKEKLGTFMNAVGTFTRLYSGLATRFNPEFALPNKIRDLQETAVFLASQKGIGFKGAAGLAGREIFQQNTRAVIDALRGKSSEGARLYNEMKSLGGTTGGFGLSTKKQVGLNLEQLERLANSKTRRIGDNLVKFVDNWNTIFEDSTRLSVYRQALSQGLSKERAAFLAKEASINFNRMGKGGPVINALYMFSNASIQGSAKMIRSLRNPKVLGATMLAVGGSVATVNQWNDKIDPDWRNKVSKWDRLNGLTLILPNKEGEGVKYITIPVSWGIKPIKVMSDYAYDSISGKGFNAKDFTQNTLTSILEAYNPVGGTDFWSAITPTALDLPSEIARNVSWSGSKIRPDYDSKTPEDIKYFQSLRETKTGQAAISLTELLQSKAGIAISPANIKYAYDNYIGGAGRTVSKTINTIAGAAQGKLPPVDEYPMVSRFYRQRTEEELGQGSSNLPNDIQSSLEAETREKFKQKEKITPIYEKAQELKKQGKADEAQRIVDKLSDDEYEIYKNIKKAEKAKQTKSETKKMLPTVMKVRELVKAGKKDQAQSIVDEMTDEEYERYQSAKNQLGD